MDRRLPENPIDETSGWKTQVRGYFRENRLGSTQASALEAMLLARPVSLPPEWAAESTAATGGPLDLNGVGKDRGAFAPPVSPWSVRSLWTRAHGTGLGYLVTAALAASLTFVVGREMEDESSDPIAELANQSGARMYYPADFDLEGDPSGFKEIVRDVFPSQDVFLADLPKQIDRGYLPSEGRFFTWSGEPGVSIQLKATHNAVEPPATLYIVRLTDKNEGRFPKERTTKRIAAGKSGKAKKVNVWRDGKYGYAMVQAVASNE